MPEVTTCPQCQRQLRVPDEMIGTQVKCPECGATFTATSASRPAPGPSPGAGHYSDEAPKPSGSGRRAYNDDFDRDRGPSDWERRPRRYDDGGYAGYGEKPGRPWWVIVPAVFMILSGIGGVILDIVQVVSVAANDGQPVAAVAGESEFEKGMREGANSPFALVLGGAGLIVSILVIVSAIQIFRGKTYGLAVAGSVLSIINFVNCCCLVGLPFGIWALIALLQPQVKESFD